MADTLASTPPAGTPPAAVQPAVNPAAASAAPAFKKGALVRVARAAYGNSLEAGASDPEPPAYIFEGPGEILAIKGAHAQLRWRRPVPDVWLRLDQLEAYPAA